ncbi:hypothetical protein [Streptomyces sp. NRRL F-5123]|uniref:hypothetical protein n=1 Tax=Streptomyces sp. NRRL F-5123 TaxID=1463856 RepID=UPI000694F99F|nr:hypothetical protein [Streptomyces sp. NRRL F-5123]
MTARLRRILVAAAVLETCLLSLAWPSSAKGSWGDTTPPPAQDSTTPSNTIESKVSYKYSYQGTGAHMAPPQGAAWRPPACWYEPAYSPEEFESYLNSHYVSSENAYAGMARDYGADDFHKGDKGAWWELKVPDLSRADECASLSSYAWFTPGKPPPPEVSPVDPRTLAGLAYANTVLPPPAVTVRPTPKNQLVNLPTEVAFAEPLDRVTVTASLDNAALGIHVASTVVAEPSELRVSTTGDAQPASCTYTLAKSGGGYKLNTHGAPCNITYRKASPGGGYTLTTSLVWKVHWTPSANPDGPAANPPLPDGESQAPTTVVVRESQAVVR